MTTHEPAGITDPFADVSEPDVDELLAIEAEEASRRSRSHPPTTRARAAPEWTDDRDDLGRAVGRLGAPGPDDDVPRDEDDEGDAIAWSGDEDDLSAEESAVHITYEPGFDPDDGYLGDR